jgi:hypothetical protein
MMVHETVAGGTWVATDGDLSGRGSVLVSASNGKSAERRLRRRRRKLAAATSTVLMVAAAVAGEPIALTAGASPLAGGVGAGLNGMTDPSEVGASGRLTEDDRIGDDLLDSADNPDELLELGGEEPSGHLEIPSELYKAYVNAADILAATQPNCNLDWSLLAAIGRIESNHARGGRVDTEGNTTPNILGPTLNGGGFAEIRDTDGGKWDGDSGFDRAVGAMQFIPSTWEGYASDGNDDGVKSPHNVYDATVAAGKYLCSGGLDLSDPAQRATAVFRYNHSNHYVATVLMWADAYAQGVDPLPTDTVPDDEDVFALGPPSIADNPVYPTTPATTPGTTPPPQQGTTTTPPVSSSPPLSSSASAHPTVPPTSTTTTPPCTPSTTTPESTSETTPTTTPTTTPESTSETTPTTTPTTTPPSTPPPC